MCGICGIWRRPEPARIERMVAAMSHRGPDDSGTYIDSHVSLGMSRLAVIDLSPTGHQPMSNSSKTIWIVFNGEIYNYQSERRLLENLGHEFNSSSDTEVVLRMYEEYGDDFLVRLRGIFALAIYDKRNENGGERLLLARDHFGIKPLLYSESGGIVTFGSELKAMLASGLISRDIDPVALRILLTFGSVYQPRTLLKDIKSLLPAHRMIIENGQRRIERYWSLATNRYPELRSAPYPEQVQAVQNALKETVRLQMVSDVPLGAFLSGGIDSSILVALMASQAGQRVKTFSVGFANEGARLDESNDAARTAQFLGTDHTHVLVTADDVRARILHIACSLDQPSVDGVNSYFVSWAARKRVTVALSGTGGDEMFAGYPWFQNMQAAAARTPSWGARLGSRIAQAHAFDPMLSGPLGAQLYRLRTQAGFLSRYSTQYHVFNSRGAARLLHPYLRGPSNAGTAEYFDLLSTDELSSSGVLERVSALCLRGYTSNQLLRDIDAVSMAHSLEVRVPFLDPLIADISLSLPPASKSGYGSRSTPGSNESYRHTGAKRILIDAGRSFLPPGLDKQPKRGFAMPFSEWLRGSLSDIYRDTLANNAVRKRGWFDSREVERIRENFASRRIDWLQPWLLMMTELWAREVIDTN